MNKSIPLAAALGVLLLSACSGAKDAAPTVDLAAVEAAAHDSYVAAINSNDAEKVKAVMTEEVVFQAPGAPEMVGKDTVGKWVAGYFAAYQTKWEKTSIGFTVSGDWASERYAFKAVDTDRKTGVVTTSEGKGIVIYHKDPDGQWRVAVDGWSGNTPAA